MERIVVLTGAGISAESGLQTFRGSGGLWEGHDVYEVATPEAWARNQKLVLDFYNWRRDDARKAQPNAAHKALVRLEQEYHVSIITQNVDDLHERAGSTEVLHLHGELLKARSTRDPDLVYELGDKNIQLGDCCELGSQLRPHIVWFGENVPAIYDAMEIAVEADILLVIGTSLNVYPAASLVPAARNARTIFVVDPDMPAMVQGDDSVGCIEKTAVEGVPPLVEQLLEE
ncbi:MAG: NAD-dependent deacylase [Puniceicoccaceae bacterium]